MQPRHLERHFTERLGWFCTAVLDANDSIVCTASLVTGAAAAHADQSSALVAGAAGLAAGAMSKTVKYKSVVADLNTSGGEVSAMRIQGEIGRDGCGG